MDYMLQFLKKGGIRITIFPYFTTPTFSEIGSRKKGHFRNFFILTELYLHIVSVLGLEIGIV